MKAQILKIAGVKNENEFYQKFPSEEAFMKKHGKELKKAQVGTSIEGVTKPTPIKPINYNTFYDEAEANATGISTQERQRQEALASQANIAKAMQKKGPFEEMMSSLGGSNGDVIGNVASMFRGGGYLPMAQYGGFLKSLPIKGLSDSAKALPTLTSPISADTNTFNAPSLKDTGNGLLNQGGPIIDAIRQIGEMQHQQDVQKQFAKISDVTAQAAESQDVDAKRQKRYLRPEDMAFQPGEMGNPYGQGTNYLAARNGAEIANTFAPNDIYTDMGYEPLNDSNPKQYQFGGIASAAGSYFTGGGFQESPEGKIGSIAGKTIGSFIPIPGASIIGEALGGFAGGLFGGSRQNETNNYAEQGKQNTMRAAAAGYGNALRGMNSGVMEDGGWVSNHWMPQTITKFGEYNVKDLLKPPYDADMLRAGGHLAQVDYTPASQEAMYTGRAEYGTQMAMGGDLEVHRGEAETMSYNPFLPNGGETVMFRGPSHDNGGMPISFGQNGVEVEGGEPAIKMQDGGEQENLVVYGNMFIPNYGVDELGDKNAKGKKFKNYVSDLSKVEAKQNKIVEKSTNVINSLDVNDPFSKLTFAANQANILGANMKLKEIADKKITAASVQNAILDTAEEYGLVSDALAKGKIVKDKEAMKKAKFGAKMETAQAGKVVKYDSEFENFIDQAIPFEVANSYDNNNYRGGGSNFGTNKADIKTPEEAKEYYYKNYWSKVKDLPAGLRTRALQLAINTGDPYGELMVAAGKMSVKDRAATKDQRKDKAITGNKDWEASKADILKAYKEDPQAFLGKLDSEQNRYYDSLVKANTKEGKTFGSINPDTSREFYDDYMGMARYASQQYIPNTQSATTPSFSSVTSAPISPSSKYAISGLLDLMKAKGIDTNVSSGYRGGAKTKQGNKSRHSTNEAMDLTFPTLGKDAYQLMVEDKDIARYMFNNNLTAINEYDPKIAKKVGATGSNVHIGLDKGTPTAEAYRKDVAERHPDVVQEAAYKPITGQSLPQLPEKDVKYLQDLYAKAQKAGKGPEVLKFQQEYNRLAPDYAKSVIGNDPLTNYAKKQGYGVNDLRGNEDGLFGQRTKDYNAAIAKAAASASGTTPLATKQIKPLTTGLSKLLPNMQQPLPVPKTDHLGNAFNFVQSLLPRFRTTNQEGLDSQQLSGEMLALASNQVSPVQAQLLQPLLQQPYDISLQDQLNANQSDFNAIQRQTGYNPEALSALAAQKYAANSQVLGNQFRANQEMKAGVYNKNREILNQTQAQNLGILDQQYTRQEQAKSNTKQQAVAALNSISDKIMKNKLDNRKLGIYENMYGYRFGPNGQAINENGIASLNYSGNPTASGAGNIAPGYEPLYNSARQLRPISPSKDKADKTSTAPDPSELVGKNGKKVTKKGLNSDIVKAIKGL